jgi:ubiquinone/menaquinone biosynthesis C-methylase UbiE
MSASFETIESVKNYYGKVLGSSKDLKTSACCSAEAMPAHLRPIVSMIHPEVLDKFYGCGSPIPSALEGKTVLDLGSGTGRDCYILSKLVGAQGKVIGVDMTDEQIAVAQKHIPYHTEKFGFTKPNVEFRKGYIEDLSTAGIEPNSVDLVVSNCVVNLSPNKKKVFSEVFRALKPGGEIYYSDVFSTRRVPKPLTEDPILLGECLGGALYIEDFRRILQDLGVRDYRVVSSAPLSLSNTEVFRKAGMIEFYSITIRAFKMDLEDRCEDFGQVATFKGGICELPHGFTFDKDHYFEKNKPQAVCSNTARMLSQSRYGKYFSIMGDESTHYGLFECGPKFSGNSTVSTVGANTSNAASCC